MMMDYYRGHCMRKSSSYTIIHTIIIFVFLLYFRWVSETQCLTSVEKLAKSEGTGDVMSASRINQPSPVRCSYALYDLQRDSASNT